MQETENRRTPRKSLPYLSWHADVESEHGVQSAICVDISPGGLGLHVARPPDVGSNIHVTVHLPGGDIATGRGIVAHVSGHKPRIGLTLHQMDRGMHHAISSLLEA